MDITLSFDAGLIRKAREYAKARGTSLNHLLVDYMTWITDEPMARRLTPKEAADLFVRIAEQSGGRSPDGWKFDREDIHRRGGGTD